MERTLEILNRAKKSNSVYNIYNALAATAVGRILGLSYPQIRARLARFEFPKSRFSLVKFKKPRSVLTA